MRGKFPCSILLLIAAIALLGGCRGAYLPAREPPLPRVKMVKKVLPRLGFTIQTGAFSQVDNAVKLVEDLRAQGIEATYFKDRDSFFKVRFGNYRNREDAVTVAVVLKSMRVIDEYYVVMPEEYAISKGDEKGLLYVQEELVKTAYSFLGVPYLWGGASLEEGFDCSGLTMTVYQLNGIDLPRTAAKQYQLGEPVEKEELEKGDLVFFSTAGRGKVTHVGIYVGENKFIHAPRRGKRINVERLDNTYFARHYIGARRYLF